MKLALAFMYMNADLPWLKLHLPVYLSSGAFDGVVGVAGERQISRILLTVAVTERVPVSGVVRPFDNHFAAQGNALIDACERAGYTHMLRIDPDELMFPMDCLRIRAIFEGGSDDLLGFNRYHFVGDRLHVNPAWSPDGQWRAWKLNEGVRYPLDQKVHEIPRAAHGTRLVDDLWIYHYAWLASADERDYRTALYAALQNGSDLPQRDDFRNRPPLAVPRMPFTGVQPLDPAVIGVRAPFEDIAI